MFIHCPYFTIIDYLPVQIPIGFDNPILPVYKMDEFIPPVDCSISRKHVQSNITWLPLQTNWDGDFSENMESLVDGDNKIGRFHFPLRTHDSVNNSNNFARAEGTYGLLCIVRVERHCSTRLHIFARLSESHTHSCTYVRACRH